MSKIIIPFKGFFKTEYDPFCGLVSFVNPEIDYSTKSPFSNPNNKYIIQPVWPDKRNYKTKSVQITSQDIGKLKINPDSTVVINADQSFSSLNVVKWNSTFHHEELKNVFPVKKLIANSPNEITLSFTNIDQTPSTVKEITLNSAQVNCQLSDLHNIQKLVIKNPPFQNQNQCTCLQLDDCPNIQEIDLSGVDKNLNYFFFTSINPDCKIKLNPKCNFLIQSSSSPVPFSKHYLNVFKAPESKVDKSSGYYNPQALILRQFNKKPNEIMLYNELPSITFQEFVGQKYIKNGIIEISAKEFAHEIVEFERKLFNKYFDNYDKIIQHQLSDTKTKQPIQKQKEIKK